MFNTVVAGDHRPLHQKVPSFYIPQVVLQLDDHFPFFYVRHEYYHNETCLLLLLLLLVNQADMRYRDKNV